MQEHHDTIQRLTIILDDDIRQFELYATRIENKVKAQVGPKMAFTEQKYRAYDVDGVTLILRADPSFLGVPLYSAYAPQRPSPLLGRKDIERIKIDTPRNH